MSMCVQGILPTNRSRNFAAVIAPPHRPSPTFLMSATSLLICSSYSSYIGSCQTDSPTDRAAAATASHHGWSFVNNPATSWPSATMQAPVNVAASTIRRGCRPRTTSRTSASTTRPSASVL